MASPPTLLLFRFFKCHRLSKHLFHLLSLLAWWLDPGLHRVFGAGPVLTLSPTASSCEMCPRTQPIHQVKFTNSSDASNP